MRNLPSVKKLEQNKPKKGASVKRRHYPQEFAEPIVAGGIYSKSLRRFVPPLTSGKTDLDQYSRELINARADYLSINDSLGAAISGRLCDYVIGTGLKPKACINHKRLGISRSKAIDIQDMIESDFTDWAQSKESDFLGESSFFDSQIMNYFLSFNKGETFFKIPHDISSPMEEINVSIRHQTIDPDRVRNENYAVDSKDIVSGMRLDLWGRVLSYFISRKFPYDYTDIQGANEIIEEPKYIKFRGQFRKNIFHHVRRKKKSDALRGMSIYVGIMEDMFDIHEYRRGEIRAAVNQGKLVFGYFSDEEESPFDEMKDREEIDRSSVGLKGNQLHIDGTTLIEGDSEAKLDMLQPTRPFTGYVEFNKDSRKNIAAAIGIPHQVLDMLFDASFSASRAATMQFTDFCVIESTNFGNNYCTPHYRRFIEEKVMLGDYNLPGFIENVAIRNAYSGVRWIGPTIAAIKESEQASAAKIRTDAEITSKQYEREKLGLDNELMEQQIERERPKSEPINRFASNS